MSHHFHCFASGPKNVKDCKGLFHSSMSLDDVPGLLNAKQQPSIAVGPSTALCDTGFRAAGNSVLNAGNESKDSSKLVLNSPLNQGPDYQTD